MAERYDAGDISPEDEARLDDTDEVRYYTRIWAPTDDFPNGYGVLLKVRGVTVWQLTKDGWVESPGLRGAVGGWDAPAATRVTKEEALEISGGVE